MKQPLIELKNIERYHTNGDTLTTVLKSINLKIYSGEMVAIVGASGSGKSTLMNIIGALDVPNSGEYFIYGRNIADLSGDELAELRCRHFGFVFQRYHLLSHLTAVKNVEVPAIYAMADKILRNQRANALLCQLGLEKQLENKPAQLSGGQQQRVSIARALMNGGDIILADEPTGALDSQSSQDVLKILKDLNRKGHTVILITHDLAIAEHADRVICIQDGKIVSDTANALESMIKPQNKRTFIDDAVIEVCQQHNTEKLNRPNEKNNIDNDNKENNNGYNRNDNSFLNNPKKKLNSSILRSFNSYAESFFMAFNMMMAHKIRTFLTMLGIIIGIIAVVFVIALGEGTKKKVLDEFSSLGNNTIDIFPGKWGDESDNVHTLNMEDLELLYQQPYVQRATPVLLHIAKARYLNKTMRSLINGVSHDFFMLKNYQLVTGRLFDQNDLTLSQPVGVIDKKSAKLLFDMDDPINKIIFIDDIPLSIIGVVESSSLQQNSGKEILIWIPHSTMATRILNQSYIQQISVQLQPNVSPLKSDKAIIDLLTIKHGQKDFYTFSSSRFLQSLNKTTQALTLMISSIAFISLIVGGIGIMNIMLVSVIERTKEIGIRIAVGAKERDIRFQFLIESTMVSLIGGCIGVGCALLFGGLFSLAETSIKIQFTLSSFLIAFLCSSMIGIVFGYFPARNAAKLRPVDALSRE
ncbi:macrolide ABC transporter permease/ATP-binding protein MacB [[Haemophilus] ducreyi]|uniref:Macrolide export ATP-binding/permease protein MacB n=2 Tax=Haemophilus ducreyi TaxID=730 RepID=MACB_HAEDU|nr:MacB family efflux pump subunit [[Haemophilus] ducreyi]Q7VMF9.1 RecName: Full=Macrolide export ATP-binding/permease protein MacB [[Haemophilus] ducreyi 35000HP]AAP95897.1 macrolide-specific ABC-type efflux carrier [[Haemophilus] ducreyi 35000HP]AKO30911.1 macrolide transporter [[Haemophilus] ducreyi]AKO32350.1 macrolide transporter [[Haemophilus] ducreyi]AKO35248.1 macrolide transporter [[Haemophilus] ducreyi]AKO36685.1 macrolide transporter [[Haemophilus] ducreyi]